MFKNNKNLLIIGLIALVNALGYGIIIPVLYTYSQKFGLTDFQNGLLFSIFSICQFIATPVIGRLSDKFGRRPMLLISILGTAISFFLMAFAPSAIFLFLARALDGITSGNIPVASAVISDTTEPKDRAKGFGIIGASFGFGFVFGPAIAALTLHLGTAVPFIIAGIVSMIAVVLTYFFLPETNKHMGEVKKGSLFDFKKLILSITDKRVGITLAVSFFYSLAFSLFIYAYQPVAVKVLNLSATQISLNFTLFGFVGLISQVLIIPKITRKLGEKKSLLVALIILVNTFVCYFFVNSFAFLIVISIIQALANGFVSPMIQSLLSKEADSASQGTMQGLNQSYVSIGQIIGPIIGGAAASFFTPLPFLVGSGVVLLCVVLSYYIKLTPQKLHAFK